MLRWANLTLMQRVSSRARARDAAGCSFGVLRENVKGTLLLSREQSSSRSLASDRNSRQRYPRLEYFSSTSDEYLTLFGEYFQECSRGFDKFKRSVKIELLLHTRGNSAKQLFDFFEDYINNNVTSVELLIRKRGRTIVLSISNSSDNLKHHPFISLANTRVAFRSQTSMSPFRRALLEIAERVFLQREERYLGSFYRTLMVSLNTDASRRIRSDIFLEKVSALRKIRIVSHAGNTVAYYHTLKFCVYL